MQHHKPNNNKKIETNAIAFIKGMYKQKVYLICYRIKGKIAIELSGKCGKSAF